ncbi:MAG: hypothetical protein [Inoviridae sp.]|nr:MAG: hypothetical protein [Inoviridae sp.]
MGFESSLVEALTEWFKRLPFCTGMFTFHDVPIDQEFVGKPSGEHRDAHQVMHFQSQEQQAYGLQSEDRQ